MSEECEAIRLLGLTPPKCIKAQMLNGNSPGIEDKPSSMPTG